MSHITEALKQSLSYFKALKLADGAAGVIDGQVQHLVNLCEKALAEPVKQKPVADYAYATVKEYEELAGFSVTEAFRAGWNMARTTNSMLDIKSAPTEYKWPVMGYGNIAVGQGAQPDGPPCIMYLEMGETREIDADTSDLFPVGSEVDQSKLLACIYFKDSAAVQQTIDLLHEMQQEFDK